MESNDVKACQSRRAFSFSGALRNMPEWLKKAHAQQQARRQGQLLRWERAEPQLDARFRDRADAQVEADVRRMLEADDGERALTHDR